MPDILDRLIDLHKQATTERSHYYVASTCLAAIDEIKRNRELLSVVLSSLEHLGMDAFADAPFLIRALRCANAE